MKKIFYTPSRIFSFACVLLFFSCKKEKSCEGCIGNNNKPPIAIAGLDKLITLPTDSTLLDGSSSNDPDGTITEWLWTKISGPASYTINNATISRTIVKNLVVGIYQFELMVKDNKGLTDKDTVQVSVDDPRINQPPVANASADQSITLPVNSVTVDGGGSTDPDNNIVSYQWTKISGPPSFNISNASTIQTQVNNLAEGVYQFELKVTDAGMLYSKDTMNVNVNTTVNDTCNFANLPYRHATLTQVGTLSVPRMPIAATAGNKVIFAGGWASLSCGNTGAMHSSPSSVIDIFDVSNHIRTTAQLSMPRGGIRTVSCGNKVFFAGGEDGISTTYDNVDIYDISTNTWTAAHLSTPRAYLATATVGTKVFFAGGYYYSASSPTSIPNNASNKVDIYDLSSGQWTTATLSGTATDLYTATALSGKVYFSGGNNGVIDIYDNATNTWSIYYSQLQWSSFGFQFPNPFVSFAVGNNIYWAGIKNEGYDPTIDDDRYTGKAEILNTATNTTSIRCIPAIYSRHPVLRNNEVAFFGSYRGGMFGGWSIHNLFSIYNTATNNWFIGRTDQNFFTGNYDAGIVSANNTIYVGGGSEPVSGCLTVSNKVYILNW